MSSSKFQTGKIEFRPTGFSAGELENLAALEFPLHPKTVKEAEIYGCGKEYRKRAYYPSFLPICLFIPHGSTQWDYLEDRLFPAEQINYAFFTDRIIKHFKERSGRKAYKITSPFVSYRHKNNVQLMPDAKGSLFFYAHSTLWTDLDTDHKSLLEDFKALPAAMHPISICMHYMDIIRKRHIFFIENGFPVYCAGSSTNHCFIENFYEIIRHFKYVISNTVGSHFLYAAEMGIRCRLVGKYPEMMNNVVKDFENNRWRQHVQIQKNYKVFEQWDESNKDEQKRFAEAELGLHGAISRLKFAWIMYVSLFEYIINYIKAVINLIYKKIIR